MAAGITTGPVSGITGLDVMRTLSGSQAVGSPPRTSDASVPFKMVLQESSALHPSRAGEAPDSSDKAAVYKHFEAMFVSQLVSAMMNAGGENVFGEGTAMSAYSSLFADAIGDQIAERGGLGIANILAKTNSR